MQLLRSPFASQLPLPYRALLDDLAKARSWPTSEEPARLGALVRKLSLAYNDATVTPPRGHEALAARLVFSFPRDVPKGAGAVRELVASGALSFAGKDTLRVLDVGAGLGATSRGIARALAAKGEAGTLAIHAIDSDGDALTLAKAIARARPEEEGVRVSLEASTAPVTGLSGSGPYDVIVLGQVLSELDRGAGDARAATHAALLAKLEGSLADDGALVVVEPALRERARHLQTVRDRVLAGSATLNVFAPCTHDAPCPMLSGSDADWCHEDLDVDLPEWLVPVAKAAGLRWEGLTFSYLVLRKDGRRFTPLDVRALRVVSAPVVTKGKRELFLCSADAEGASQRKVMRLDRHETDANAVWDDATRGDVLTVTPPVDPQRPRVLETSRVARLT